MNLTGRPTICQDHDITSQFVAATCQHMNRLPYRIKLHILFARDGALRLAVTSCIIFMERFLLTIRQDFAVTM